MDSSEATGALAATIKNMTEGLSSTRELLKTVLERCVWNLARPQSGLNNHRKESNPTEFDTRDGISLLSLKHHLMLSYLQAATLLIANRGLGHPLVDRSPPNAPFASSSRPSRGDQAGDLVDHLVEGRLVLEKTKILEARMKYQIEKLVRLATEKQATQNPLNGKHCFILSLFRTLKRSLVHRSAVVPTEPSEPRR